MIVVLTVLAVFFGTGIGGRETLVHTAARDAVTVTPPALASPSAGGVLSERRDLRESQRMA